MRVFLIFIANALSPCGNNLVSSVALRGVGTESVTDVQHVLIDGMKVVSDNYNSCVFTHDPQLDTKVELSPAEICERDFGLESLNTPYICTGGFGGACCSGHLRTITLYGGSVSCTMIQEQNKNNENSETYDDEEYNLDIDIEQNHYESDSETLEQNIGREINNGIILADYSDEHQKGIDAYQNNHNSDEETLSQYRGGRGNRNNPSGGDRSARCEEGRWAHRFWRCSAQTQYCQLPVGECTRDIDRTYIPSVGVCTRRPQSCGRGRDTQRVCGCDGRSYSSACEAHRNGINVARMGACQHGEGTCRYPDGSTRADGCISGQFCQTEAGVCPQNSGLQRGRCHHAGSFCNREYHPVCGCNRRTYSSICSATAAGVNVMYNGVCRT